MLRLKRAGAGWASGWLCALALQRFIEGGPDAWRGGVSIVFAIGFFIVALGFES